MKPDSEEMYGQWELAMRALVAVGGARGALVFVVVTPDAGPDGVFSSLSPRIRSLNEIHARLGASLVDWRRALQPEGPSTSVVPQPTASVNVRAADGLHLTDEGDRLVAQATWNAIEPALSSEAPAIPAP